MSVNNNLFKKSLDILKANNINYWVCHGTLLGIIRNKNLLDWDHDIDFAVWEDEHSKEEIIKLFSNDQEYTQEISLEEINSLHFATLGKRIDINFYTRDNNKAYIKWAVPSEGNSKIFNQFKRLYHFILFFLVNNLRIKDAIKSSKTKTSKIIKFFTILPLTMIRKILSNKIKRKLLKLVYKEFDILGYSFPLNLMEFEEMVFNGIKIRIPKNPEEVLEFTYGKDWKIPKKNYVWYKEAKNLYRLEKNN